MESSSRGYANRRRKVSGGTTRSAILAQLPARAWRGANPPLAAALRAPKTGTGRRIVWRHQAFDGYGCNR